MPALKRLLMLMEQLTMLRIQLTDTGGTDLSLLLGGEDQGEITWFPTLSCSLPRGCRILPSVNSFSKVANVSLDVLLGL